ncbi:dihydrofolate reductase family protein [Parendozoicomonas haliclonae]|uniref:Dihydrofolate reductase n=1 Tax=Parendozoicomonas haliclonae TaxID=1960125 RepID=A0A1X7AR48_9GAMM|nr:dihydrofolate reductase family protein [Parendozoicomonas haliclonae]SMA50786.1 Dihydrofolate reductase [Parendozoicomonas haliclonae]
MPNILYLGASIDGYIADRDGGLDWLHCVPNPDHDDFGFAAFMDSIDALIMGRNTFETVCGFDCPWPYSKPVFVVSRTLSSIPEAYQDKAELLKVEEQSTCADLVALLNSRGYKTLYIDGGKTVQSFLQEDLIDEMIITTVPVVLGGGVPLFGELAQPLSFALKSSDVLLNAMVKNHYLRTR